MGYLGSRFAPEKFIKPGSNGSKVSQSYGPAILDDHSSLPSHAVFSWYKVSAFIAIGLGVWFIAMAALVLSYGWENTLSQMAWFFTKAAFVTFGGAYAVLPYVYQGGVEQYGWLTATQMIDGLALGETTPGPLIMVVAFIGFVGAWVKEIFGPEMQLLAGAVAAAVVTFFTFLPSFIFIFVGGPAVEATRDDVKFTAPLTGITAAVVGVIVNLAVFFAYHVLWPQGINESFLSSYFDWFSALIGLAACIALYKFSFSIPKLIVISAFVGMVYKLIL